MNDVRESVPRLGEALELMRRLWSVAHELEVLSSRMAKRLGITAQQRMVLRIAGRFPGITAGRLSELLCVDAATVSTTLARLESRGLLRRERDPRDRRRVTVALTARGRTLDAPREGTVESAVQRVLGRCGDADVAAARRVLEALARSLRDEACDVAPAALRASGR
jgi:DNA-binding MarR family transcriptional regulator